METQSKLDCQCITNLVSQHVAHMLGHQGGVPRWCRMKTENKSMFS